MQALSGNLRSIVAMLAAAAMFSCMDALLKVLSGSYSPMQVTGMRGLVAMPLVCAYIAWRREFAAVFSPRLRWRLHLLRSAMLASMTGLNFWALQYLQLAVTGAMQFTVPILIALMSSWWLHEKLDARRWLAVVGGFLGVLLVIRPGSQDFHPAIFLSVMNALLYAAFNMLTRRMAATESPQAMQLLSASGAALVLAVPALLQWRSPPDGLTWAVLVLCGLMGGVGHLFVAMAHRYASASVLGPFLYQQILYMTLWGWLVFQQVPDAFVVAGALVVVASGLYLLWLEMRRA